MEYLLRYCLTPVSFASQRSFMPRKFRSTRKPLKFDKFSGASALNAFCDKSLASRREQVDLLCISCSVAVLHRLRCLIFHSQSLHSDSHDMEKGKIVSQHTQTAFNTVSPEAHVVFQTCVHSNLRPCNLRSMRVSNFCQRPTHNYWQLLAIFICREKRIGGWIN